MFRKRLVAYSFVAAAFAGGSLVGPTAASAQTDGVIDLDDGGSEGGVIDLDEGEEGAAPSGPVSAGPMTPAAAKAKKLFDDGQWMDAAMALHRVVSGETGDDIGNQQLAMYHLAIALYRLKFYQPSYAFFSFIANDANHIKHDETLLWLAKLATQLPEAADIVSKLGKYSDSELARFDNDKQRDLYWQLHYMFGRYKYSQGRAIDIAAAAADDGVGGAPVPEVAPAEGEAAEGEAAEGEAAEGEAPAEEAAPPPPAPSADSKALAQQEYADAVRLFQKVGRESEFYVQAQFFTGITYVQLKKSAPAVSAFQRVEKALAEGVKGVEDKARMRDLAYLSMARTYYTASVSLNPETNEPTIDADRLSAAVKYWNLIDTASEYWLDALFEQSWAYFMAGDYPHAMGNIHTIQSPYFPNAFYPEADVLKAVIYFYNCDYNAADIVVTDFLEHYEPIRDDLRAVLGRFKADEHEKFYKFLEEVKGGTAELNDSIRGIVEGSLGDRQLLKHMEYVKLLDSELARYKESPPSFQKSAVGEGVKVAIEIAREEAVKEAGELARNRYKRAIDELNGHLRNAKKLRVDITNARRNILDAALKDIQVTSEEDIKGQIVKPDEEHVLWPFDGEYWRDELGFYRQTVVSVCGR